MARSVLIPTATLLLLVLGGVLAFFGTRGGSTPRTPERRSTSPRESVVSIEMPHEEPHLPPGPNREKFLIACTSCHSPRLALTQPRFSAEKWKPVVHKMVAVYGAPLTPGDEAEIVAYLAVARGP